MDGDEEPIADAVADAVAEPIAEAIGDVIAEQGAAQETLEHIAEAALEGERGRRIDQLEQGLAACLETVNNLATAIEQLPMMLAQTTLEQLEPISQRLNAVEDGQAALTAAALSTLTPPPLEEPPLMKTVEPAVSSPPGDAEESLAPEPRARRFRSV